MIITDNGFSKLLFDKTNLAGSDFKVVNVELSKSDTGLGETDITAVFQVEDQKYGFLIEDKIDAIAHPDQFARYTERGKLGVQEEECDDFYIFILCPEKYLHNNTEASLYEYKLPYEEIKLYLSPKKDLVSLVRYQQIEQAISKAKKTPVVILNEAVNAFFREYKAYQKEKYPELNLRTKETSNVWWAHYNTRFGDAYILHKMQEGLVDLTFPNAATKLEVLESMAFWLRQHGVMNVFSLKTGKAGVLRIEVPKLAMAKDFSNTSADDLESCFNAILFLNAVAGFLEDGYSVRHIDKTK